MVVHLDHGPRVDLVLFSVLGGSLPTSVTNGGAHMFIVAVMVLGLVCGFALREMWDERGGWWLAASAFGVMTIGIAAYIRWMRTTRSWAHVSPLWLMLLGAVLNATAVLSNNGVMPVSTAYYPIYNLVTHAYMTDETRVPWLCDILWGGSSIGDWLLAAGPILFLLESLRRTLRHARQMKGATHHGQGESRICLDGPREAA